MVVFPKRYKLGKSKFHKIPLSKKLNLKCLNILSPRNWMSRHLSQLKSIIIITNPKCKNTILKTNFHNLHLKWGSFTASNLSQATALEKIFESPLIANQGTEAGAAAETERCSGAHTKTKSTSARRTSTCLDIGKITIFRFKIKVKFHACDSSKIPICLCIPA